MEIGFILKIAGIGMIVAVCAQVLSRAGRDDQAMLVSVAGIILGLILLVGELGELIRLITEAFGI